MKQKTKQLLFLTAAFVAAIAADQWTKALAVAHLSQDGPIVLWDGVFELMYIENRGAAFGMLQGKQWFFTLIAVVVLAAVVYCLLRMPEDQRYWPMKLSVTFIAAGAVGNMIDRFAQGYVVDFLYFSLINFPVFNVADCYVTVATAVLMCLILFYYKEEELAVFSLNQKGESH